MRRLLRISGAPLPIARARPISHHLHLHTHIQQHCKYRHQQHWYHGRVTRRWQHRQSRESAPSLAPSLPLPTFPLYHLFPAPVSRVGYGGVTRPAVINEDTVLEEVTSLVEHRVNVVEIGKTWTHSLSEAVKKQQNSSAPIIFTHSISWAKLCKWIIGRRKDLHEQKKAAAEQEEKREMTRQTRLKNAAATGKAVHSDPELDGDSAPRIFPHVRASGRTEKIVVRPTAGQSQDAIMQQANTMVADTFQREADRRQQRLQQQQQQPSSTSSSSSATASVPLTDNLSELLPTADLSLITDSTAAVDWQTIDLFPYLHAYLLDLCVVHELPHIDILILTDVDTPLTAPSGDDHASTTTTATGTATDAHTVWNAQPEDELFQRWFIAFEQLVLAQRLRWYGVHSTRFALPAEHPHFLSLPTLIEVAQTVVDEPHFTVIRYPFNAFNTDIATLPNIAIRPSSSLPSASASVSASSPPPSSYVTTLEYARSRGLLTLSDSSTDAIDHNGFSRRLQSFPLSDNGRELVTQLTTLMNDARWLEFEYLRLIKEHAIPAAQLPDPLDVFWANSLAVQWEQWYNLPVFEQIRWEQINETLPTSVMTIYRLPFTDMTEWAKQYRWITSALFKCVFNCLEYEIAWQSKEMNDFLVSVCPALDAFPRLEHKYLLLYLSAEGSDVLLTDDVASVVSVLQIAGEVLIQQAKVKTRAELSADMIRGFPSKLLDLSPAAALRILHQCEQKFGAWEPHPMSEQEVEQIQAERAAAAQQSSDATTTTTGTAARPMPEQPATTQKHLTGKPRSFFDIKRERITALQVIWT